MVVTIKKQIPAQNLLAVVTSFLTPVLASLAIEQSVSTKDMVYAIVFAIAATVLVLFKSGLDVKRRFLEICKDAKLSPAEKCAAYELLLEEICRDWLLNFEMIKGHFAGSKNGSTPDAAGAP